jgi:hypothetical protein
MFYEFVIFLNKQNRLGVKNVKLAQKNYINADFFLSQLVVSGQINAPLIMSRFVHEQLNVLYLKKCLFIYFYVEFQAA